MKIDLSEARWFKSSYSGANADCVEAAHLSGGKVAVRDSKLGAESPVLVFTPGEWNAFTSGVRNGDFNRS